MCEDAWGNELVVEYRNTPTTTTNVAPTNHERDATSMFLRLLLGVGEKLPINVRTEESTIGGRFHQLKYLFLSLFEAVAVQMACPCANTTPALRLIGDIV